MPTLDNLRAAAQDFLSEESRAKIQERLSKILEEKPNESLTLVFCGTFSSGKSSLINELLRPKFKLPVGVNPVTKFVTRLKYGKKFECFYLWRGVQYSLDTADLEDIITGKLSLPVEAMEIIIKLPIKMLRGGVEILDTPGFLDKQELTELTRLAVAKSDIALFCCNAAVVGKKFEEDYFQELEDTIGNFCVIINRKDALNTAEDFTKVQTFIEGKIEERGRAILHFLGMKKIFLTTAGGNCIDFGEFQKFFSLLCTGLSKKFRRRLQRYAYQKRTIHALKILSAEVQAQIYSGEYFYSCACNALNSEQQKARKIYLTMCKKISKQLENISAEGRNFLTAAFQEIEQKFDDLEDRDPPANFCDKANDYLHTKLRNVTEVLRKRLKEIFPAQNFEDKNFFADYTALVDNYSVPEPVGKHIKKGNSLLSIFGKLTGNSKTDKEIIYENYGVDAKINLRERLFERLQAAMNKYFNFLEGILKPSPPSQNDAFLETLADCKQKWLGINNEIIKYLNFSAENFMWGLSRNEKFLPL